MSEFSPKEYAILKQMHDAPDQYARAQETIDNLRREVGALTLADDPARHEAQQRLVDAEHRLAGLQMAEAEQVRRQREAQVLAAAARLTRLREQLAALEGERLDAVTEAEISAKRAAGALRKVLEVSQEIHGVILQIGGRAPDIFVNHEVELRLSDRLIRVLCTIKDGVHKRFGAIEWRPPFNTASSDWREDERKAGASALESFIIQPREETP